MVDEITGLGSRKWFLKKISKEGEEFYILIIDIDDFKLVNFSYGYEIGDKVLKAFASRLKRLLNKYSSNFYIARVLGNGFGIVIKDLSRTDIEQLYHKYFERVQFKIGKDIFTVSTSCGVAHHPEGINSGVMSFKDAEEALFEAKRKGKNSMVFLEEKLISEINRLQETRRKIMSAIEERSIEPYFQPIVNLKTGRVFGYEVLARIFYKGELIKGDYAIAVADAFNLTPEIDKIIFEKASPYLKEHILFLNLSMKFFFRELNNIWKVVKEKNLKSSNIVLEITESQKVTDEGVAKSIFQIFKDMQAKVAIDDFGSGYSSYSYLKTYPADILKIDGSFIRSAKEDIRDLAIVRSIVLAAQPFNLKTLAEFIEDEEDYRLMKDIGVSLGQGYFIGKPKPEPYEVKMDI